MKLKITSKGTPGSTRVVDADTGEELKDVVRVEWVCDLDKSEAVITIKRVEAVIVSETHGITQEPFTPPTLGPLDDHQ